MFPEYDNGVCVLHHGMGRKSSQIHEFTYDFDIYSDTPKLSESRARSSTRWQEYIPTLSNLELDTHLLVKFLQYPRSKMRQVREFKYPVDKNFRVSVEDEWREVCQSIDFDYIIVGSSICAYAFIERVLKNHPVAKILVLERGEEYISEHIQNTQFFPDRISILSDIESEFWTISPETQREGLKQVGVIPLYGGRSPYWSTWCPSPDAEEMAGWPQEVVSVVQRYLKPARETLGVIETDKIISIDKPIANSPNESLEPVYGVMQRVLLRRFNNKKWFRKIKTAREFTPAPLAAKPINSGTDDFEKFSVPSQIHDIKGKLKGGLLQIIERFVVEKINTKEGSAFSISGRRDGEAFSFLIGKAKIILAANTICNTMIVLNSFPEVRNAGKRYTGHFITSIVSRVPRKKFSIEPFINDNLQMAAIYVSGEDKKFNSKYHIQITAISNPNPENEEQLARSEKYMPDLVETASREQLRSSSDHVIFICSALGEMKDNPNNYMELDLNQSDITRNIIIHFSLTQSEKSLWSTMSRASYEVIEDVLSPVSKKDVEYWHKGRWTKNRAPGNVTRRNAVVHEGSTLWIGREEEAVVGLDYRLKKGNQVIADNVFVTGGALWPTSGSWNPTLTMVALCQHLADSIS